jgi:hypothetical protein
MFGLVSYSGWRMDFELIEYADIANDEGNDIGKCSCFSFVMSFLALTLTFLG